MQKLFPTEYIQTLSDIFAAVKCIFAAINELPDFLDVNNMFTNIYIVNLTKVD
jgi:hypothetical protein